MADEEEVEKVLMCSTWDKRVVASEKRQCAICGRDIAVSISAMSMVTDDPSVVLNCIPCVTEKSKTEEITFGGAPPGAVEYIRKMYGIDVTEMVEDMKKMPFRELGLERLE